MFGLSTVTARRASGALGCKSEDRTLPTWFKAFSQEIDQEECRNEITKPVANLAKNILIKYMKGTNNEKLRSLIHDLREEYIKDETASENITTSGNLYVPLAESRTRPYIFIVFDEAIEEYSKSAAKTDDDAKLFLDMLDRDKLFRLVQKTVHGALDRI
ncbi:MAG: hypothetical protein HY094_01870 [Candidatus Melainabacteria bacterium]|nr:hypothetical protein [Candidatus Melainabacteria bacterium]